MNHYWASFVRAEERYFRLDTRVYLSAIDDTSGDDTCLGAFIGKNPGSAKPKNREGGLGEIDLGDDKCLRAVLDITRAAYQLSGIEPTARGYIQILNLFYLCDPDLDTAIQAYSHIFNPLVCNKEDQEYRWVWYGWGPFHRLLNPLKGRFEGLNTSDHFFFDHGKKIVVSEKPSIGTTAKHTQGLPQKPVIDHLAALLRSQNTGPSGESSEISRSDP